MKTFKKIINAACNFVVRSLVMFGLIEFMTFISAIDSLAEGEATFGAVCKLGLAAAIFMFFVAAILPLVVAVAMEIVKFFANRRAAQMLPRYRRPSLNVAKAADSIADFAAGIFAHVFSAMCL